MLKRNYIIVTLVINSLAIIMAIAEQSVIFIVIFSSLLISFSGTFTIYLYYKNKRDRLLEFQRQEKQRNFYGEICQKMNVDQMYLDGELTLESLAKEIGSNKEVISRTINNCSGMNFRKFLNRYRIEYALNLLYQSTQLSINEVCYKSGFNSINSFNSAFYYFLRQTPTEVKTKIIDRKQNEDPREAPLLENYALV